MMDAGLAKIRMPGIPVAATPEDGEAYDSQITPEMQAEMEAENSAKLDKIGLALGEKRNEAVDYRVSNGIEDIWTRCEEHYEGVDDANRGGAWTSKPPGQAPAQSEQTTGSNVFFNITRPFVDAAVARIGDLLLQDGNWDMQPTPVPDLIKIAKGEMPKSISKQIDAQFPDPRQSAAKKQEMTAQAVDLVDIAREKCSKAKTRIEDWLTECYYQAENRKLIDTCGKIGTGIMKGPIMANHVSTAYMDGQLVMQTKLQPESRYVSHWNVYPDPACGDNIHNGAYIFEKDEIHAKKLEDLIGIDGYLESEIRKVLEEGPLEPGGKVEDRNRPTANGLRKRETKDLYQIWYYYGRMSAEDLELCGCPDKTGSADVKATMVNNHVIMVTENKLSTGEFPYDFMIWQSRENSPWGIGVAEQIFDPQRVVNAGGRRMLDNAGLASAPMILMRTGKIWPENGIWEIAPLKIWLVAEEMAETGIEDFMAQFKIDIMQQELQAIVDFGLKLAEDVTGTPMLLQGQMGAAPDSVGGMTILNNNASALPRRLARQYDDKITEPHIRRYYNYLLLFGEDDEKGDFTINARGSTSLVEKDIRNQALGAMGPYVLNPILKKDPVKWFNEFLKSQRLNPKDFDYDDEEWQKVVEQMSQSKQDPREAIAQLKAQTDEKLKTMDQQFEAQENALEREFNLILAELEREMDTFAGQNNRSMSLDQVKAKLSEAVIRAKQDDKKLRLQGYLATHKTNAAEQVATPAAEPAGRARPGRAFQA